MSANPARVTMTPRSHSVLVVAAADHAEQVGRSIVMEQGSFPHFHCGGLDAAIFGQLFWEAAEDKAAFSAQNRDSVMQLVYSSSSQSKTVVVHAVPAQVVKRYAELTADELKDLALLWSQPNGRIRMPRSPDLHASLLREVASLARAAIREGKGLLLRTQFESRGAGPGLPS